MSGPSASAPPVGTAAAGPQGHPRKWWILTAVSFGMFMALLDVTIVNIAIPAIISDLHASVSLVSWVINAYSLALAVLFLSMGRLSDKFGQKRIFIGVGLGVFTLFSLLCGLAPSIEWLIAFRVGQGIGGAALAPVSLSILVAAFPPHQRGMAVGIWGAMGSVAAAVGPTIGGILVQYFSWHWIFFVNVPVGAAAVAMALWLIPERRPDRTTQGIDVPGILISGVGLFCLVLALIEGNRWGWGSPRIIGPLGVALLSYPLFMWWELRTPWPMFDFRLLRIRSFTAANSAMFFIGTALGGAMFLLVLFLVDVLGYSEIQAAVAITPMPLTGLILAPFVGRLVDRVGPRVPGVTGALFFTVGLLLLAQLNGTSTALDATWRVVFLGAGIGFSMPTFSAAAMGSLPPQVAGVGSASLNMLRQIGFSVGLALVVAIFSHTIAQNTAQGVAKSVAYVQAQTQIPAQTRDAISAGITERAKDAAAAQSPSSPADPLAGMPAAPAGSLQAAEQQKLREGVSTIFKDSVATSFTWPFYAAALAALLAVVPALFTGHRLGQHLGHEGLTRGQRAAIIAEEAVAGLSEPTLEE